MNSSDSSAPGKSEGVSPIVPEFSAANHNGRNAADLRRVQLIILLTLITWTAVIAIFFSLGHWQIRRSARAKTQNTAASTLAEVITFRHWSANHGGVYVPATEETPPNPHLEMVEHRDLDTDIGKLTLMNPSYMTRQVFELHAADHLQAKGHITSLNPLRPENKPDPWEKLALELFEKGETEAVAIETMEGEPHLRYMRPLKVTKACLKCHAQQGYREGDIRGGISISIPTRFMDVMVRKDAKFLGLGSGVLWMLGVTAILFGGRSLRKGIQRRIDMEEERRQLDIQILNAQKNESLSILAGGVAHKYNNLLQAILGYTDMMLSNMDPTEPTYKNLYEIQKASEEASVLAYQMAAYSGKGDYHVERLDLAHEIKSMMQLIEASAPRTIDIQFDINAKLPGVYADKAQLRQIVMSLVINSVEAIGKDCGQITLTTGVVNVTSNNLRETPTGKAITKGQYVTLEVSDNGCGMDKKTLDSLFDPFFTTKLFGRGLGMAAVLGIIHAHKGAIQVRSTPGEGATVTVYLPTIPTE